MFSALVDLLFPKLCLDCRRGERVKWGLCSQCLAKVQPTGVNACIRCGRNCPPGECAPLDHRYGRVLSIALYRGSWRSVVLAVKFARDRSVAEELALELAALAQEAGFDSPQIIVPVPSASRHWRHFDVVHLVCEELSKQRNAPLLQVLARRPGRAPQIKLNQRQRTEGLDQYIYLTGSIPHGALVWLVDDVYTTGATVDACAGALLRAGARSVYVFVLGN